MNQPRWLILEMYGVSYSTFRQLYYMMSSSTQRYANSVYLTNILASSVMDYFVSWIITMTFNMCLILEQSYMNYQHVPLSEQRTTI